MFGSWIPRRVRSDRRLAGRLVVSIAAVSIALATVSAPNASATVASSLRRYPYLTDLVGGAATVNWATTTAVSAGSVAYGRWGTESCTAHTVTATRTSVTVGSTAEYQWKAQLSGLTQGAPYCYRIFGGSTDLLGSDATPVFRAQVPANAGPFSFAVFGDWGTTGSDGTNPDAARLFSQIAASGARFAVTTGDNGNGSGSQSEYGDLVQRGSDVSGIFGPAFWTVAGSSIPLFAAQGNHGMTNVPLVNWPEDRAVATSGGRYQMDTYCCANGTSSASYPSVWYAFEAGGARFYVLEATWANSNVGSTDLYDNDYDAHWTTSSAEYRWLAADLAAHPGHLKFAFFHFPMYSANATEASDPLLQGSTHLEGLLGRNGVAIAFSGHAHTYARTQPSASGMPVSYVTGGGGATLEPVSRCGAPIVAAIGWSYSSSTHGSACGPLAPPTSIDRVFHFLLVTVDGSSVTVAPTDELGRTFDVQTYRFGTGDTTPPTTPTGLKASATASSVTLTWNPSADNVGVTGYRVLRNGKRIATISSTPSYVDMKVSPSTSYRYRVKAFDAAGNVSASSAAVNVTTRAA
jgi:hypothetical protein